MPDKLPAMPDKFRRLQPNYVPRLIVNVQSLEKEGKSNFLMTAPPPIAYMNLDKRSEEDVAEKFADKQIYYNNYWIETGQNKTDYRQLWDEFKSDAVQLCNTPDIRTLGIDTGSDMYELIRMAHFGQLTQVMPQHYTALNAELSEFINKLADSDKNIVFTHKLKKQYKAVKTERGQKDTWTGKWERKGWDNLRHLVQVNILLWREDTPDENGEFKFHAAVLNCSKNPSLMGKDFVTDLRGLGNPLLDRCNFSTIAAAVFGNSIEDWK